MSVIFTPCPIFPLNPYSFSFVKPQLVSYLLLTSCNEKNTILRTICRPERQAPQLSNRCYNLPHFLFCGNPWICVWNVANCINKEKFWSLAKGDKENFTGDSQFAVTTKITSLASFFDSLLTKQLAVPGFVYIHFYQAVAGLKNINNKFRLLSAEEVFRVFFP